MVSFLFLLGIITIFIGTVAAFFTGQFFSFLLVVFGAVSSGMILIALGKIIDNQEELMTKQTSQIHHIEQKVQEIWAKDQPTSTCPGCGYRYSGNLKRCPSCYINL